MLSCGDLLRRTNALVMHSKGFVGRGVRVAVLDSGICDAHPFLQGKIVSRVVLNGRADVSDETGHGTHIASIVSAFAPKAKLIDVKVLDENNFGRLSIVKKGIEESVRMGANVINISGSERILNNFGSHSIVGLIDDLARRGVIVVIAAGNEGGLVSSATLPAVARGAIAVGAIDENNNLANFSSRGPVKDRIFPDCVSYGVNIRGAWPPDTSFVLSGTSQSAPQVSGVLACVVQVVGRGLHRDEIEWLLANGCDRLTSNSKDNLVGWGKLDCNKVINLAKSIR